MRLLVQQRISQMSAARCSRLQAISLLPRLHNCDLEQYFDVRDCLAALRDHVLLAAQVHVLLAVRRRQRHMHRILNTS